MAQLQNAVAALGAAGCRVLQASSVYETPPWGLQDQPAFLNAVVQVRWEGSAMELMDLALQVEQDLGRLRVVAWGPRKIDIDLLAFGGLELRGQRLTIPHPLLQARAFVLLPWAEIAPDFVVPGLMLPVDKLLQALPADERASIKRIGALALGGKA